MGDLVNMEPKKTRYAESELGGCPHCYRNDGYLNDGRADWIVCHQHKTKWYWGSGWSPGGRGEGEETWQRNRFKLAEYMTVDPMPPAPEQDEYRSPEELGPNRGCDEHGMPLDPAHPWNRNRIN